MKKFIGVLLVSLMLISVVLAFGASAETYKLGDINMDGKINAADARSILRAAAQVEKIGEKEMLIADVNGDSRVNAADARAVLRVASRLDKELGEINIGEPTTKPVDPADLTELSDAIGADIEDYTENFSDMKKADGDSYSNGYVTVTANPKMIAEGVISSISVTGGNYSVNGIYVGMDSDSAVSLLKSEKWTVKSDSSLSVVLSKYGMNMKLSVAGGKVTMVEYYIGTSLSDDNTTNPPAETTTQAPVTTTTAPVTTTKAPDETTTKAPDETTTQKPDETTTKLPDEPATKFPTGNDDFNALPDQIKAYIIGEYAFEGLRYDADEKTPVKMTFSSGNAKVKMSDTSSDGTSLDIEVIVDNSSGKSKLYIVNSSINMYCDMTTLIAVFPEFKDINTSGLSFTAVDLNKIKSDIYEKAFNNQKYTVYKVTTDIESCEFYMIGDEIKKMLTYDSIGNIKSQIDVTSFRTDVSPSEVSVAGMKKASIFEISKVLGVELK